MRSQTWPAPLTWLMRPQSNVAGSASIWSMVSPKLVRVSSVPACGL